MNNKINITDMEYVTILNEILVILAMPDFAPKYFDDTTMGNKNTWSNCGFCSDVIKANFISKKKQPHHRCPFDLGKETMREGSIFIDYTLGCFYRCYLFRSELRDFSFDINKMKSMILDRINEMKV